MFMSRLLPGGHLTSGRIPDRGQHGALPVPPLIVAPSGATMWGSAAMPPSGSATGSVISGPPHPPPPLVPVPPHPTDNDIDDGNKRRLSFPVPPQAGLYISDLLYRGGGIWAVRRGAASPPGVVTARGPGEEAEGRRTSAPSSPVSERREGSGEGSDDGRTGGGNMTSSITGTNSHKLKFGMDRILAKEPTKPAMSPPPQEDPVAPCLCGVAPCTTSRLGGAGGGGPGSCTTTTTTSTTPGCSPYLLPAPHSHLHRGLHTNHTSRVLDLHHLHQHHQHPGQHHQHHHHHRPRPQHHQHQHQQHHHGGPYLYRAADFPGPYSVLACDGNPAHSPNNSQQSSHQTGTGSTGKRKRSWSRAVFSHLQRKGLEKRFEVQKYVTKPDRRQLAGLLNLTDAQVKVWFQNRRMKWRHAEEAKRKRDESQQNQELLRQNSENRAREGGESSDSDIEVTDSPNGL